MKTLEKYLKRCEKNLFRINKGKSLFKILTFQKDSINYFATITIFKGTYGSEDRIKIEVRRVEDYKRISIRDKEFISPYLKNSLLFNTSSNFGSKKSSIRQSKLIKNKFIIIKNLLIENYDPSSMKRSWSGRVSKIKGDLGNKILSIISI